MKEQKVVYRTFDENEEGIMDELNLCFTCATIRAMNGEQVDSLIITKGDEDWDQSCYDCQNRNRR